MHNPDDASYRLLFSAPELVRDLVLGFIPDEWLHSLDFSTLEKVSGSYVTDDLRQRSDDVIWRVRADGEWVYLYLLIEFQSTVDRWMAVRVMTYVGLLYQDLIRRNQTLPGNKLPPVLPIVLYNGDVRWTAATEISALIPKVPGLVSRYLPKLEYLVIDENDYDEAQLSEMRNLMAAVIRLEHPESHQNILRLVDLLLELLGDNQELKRTFVIWIQALLYRRSKGELVIGNVQDLKELRMTLAEKFEQWANEHEQKGIEKGIEKGVSKGEALLLQRQLVRRFGPLPAHFIARISEAGTTDLETWGDRVLDAPTLEAVFEK